LQSRLRDFRHGSNSTEVIKALRPSTSASPQKRLSGIKTAIRRFVPEADISR
jgi:hypothetical protein